MYVEGGGGVVMVMKMFQSPLLFSVRKNLAVK